MHGTAEIKKNSLHFSWDSVKTERQTDGRTWRS